MGRNYKWLADIIDIAGKSGVRHLKIGNELEVTFGTGTISTTEMIGEGDDRVVFEHREVSPRDEMDANETQQSELIYTDPLEFERLQTEG